MKNNVDSNYCNTCERVIPDVILAAKYPCPECTVELPAYLAHLSKLPVAKPAALRVPRTMPAVLGAPYGAEQRAKGFSGDSLKLQPCGTPGCDCHIPGSLKAAFGRPNSSPFDIGPRVDTPYSFNEYQTASNETAVYPGQGSLYGVSYLIHGLTGEAGEVSNKFKKVLRDDAGTLTPDAVERLRDEMGDVLWYLQQLDTEITRVSGIPCSLEIIAVKNRAKLMLRASGGKLKGEGDKR